MLVKVEVNPVLRGHVLDVRELDLCPAAQDAFGRFVAVPVIAEGELFGGKLVAALDRQHHPHSRATCSTPASSSIASPPPMRRPATSFGWAS